jgi:HAD superfamily hydrolase (TIGR01509 family)
MAMIEAVLWDNDGLLVDSEAMFFELTRDAFAEAGFLLDSGFWGVEYLGHGKHSSTLARELGMSPELIGSVLEGRNEAFMERIRRPMPLLPQVHETILALAGKVRLGVVTGSPREKLDLMHQSSGLLEYFDVIITDDEVRNPKPHPEPYLKAMEFLGLEAADCLAVEDSLRGLSSAHAAGIACIVVPNKLTRIQCFDLAFAVEDDVSGVLKQYLALTGRTMPL